MKLRIRGNSLRLRLTQPEVAGLTKTGRVADSICFGPSTKLGYELVVSDAASAVQASLAEGRITVTVPLKMARAWAESDQVGFEGQLPLADGQSLSILVEKDFRCLDRDGAEDDADAFPNPLAGKSC